MAKEAFHDKVAQRIIEQLKQGTAPWQKPWDGSQSSPYNPVSGTRYRGANNIYLACAGYSDPRWMTYKQAAGKGYQVRKGEKGQMVQYWKFKEQVDKRDENGNIVKDPKTGKPEKVTVMLERPKCFHATVFNAEQMDGVPKLEKREYDWNPNDRAENILKASGADIREQPGDRAFYTPGGDYIVTPEKTQFSSDDKYYATALHELGHWTGHSSRLDRDLTGPFGSESYAREELRAEIGSMLLGEEIGIGHDPGQHVAYVGSWIKALEEDPKEIVRAARDAEQIMGYVLELEKELEKEVTQEFTSQSLELAATHTAVLTAIADQSNTANPGYNAMDSWKILEATAQGHGVEAVLTWAAESDPIATAEVKYLKDGVELPVTTEFSIPDGKVVTLVDGERVPGTGYTAEADWQRDALDTALTQAIETEKTVEIAPTFADLTQTHDDVLSAVIKQHQTSAELNVDSSLNTWDNLQQIASDNGLEARLRWADEAHFTPAEVIYAKDGVVLPVTTDFQPGDAKAMTLVDGQRIPGTGLTTDTKWQRDALKAGIEKAVSLQQAAEELKQSIPSEKDLSSPGREANMSKERTYIDVDYKERGEAKALGAKWDGREGVKSWYVPPGVDTAPFSKWMGEQEVSDSRETPESKPGTTQDIATEKTYLAVQYDDRHDAKALGAKWDQEAKSWYAPEGADLSKLNKWKPENVVEKVQVDPREEFKQALEAAGLKVEGDHPRMDGKLHRIPSADGKSGNRDGAYKGYLDGHPAGFYENHLTGESSKWKSSGVTLSADERAKMVAEAAEKKVLRDAADLKRHEHHARRCEAAYNLMKDATPDNGYLKAKGIDVPPGAKEDKKGRLVVPIHDKDGKIWSLQRVSPNGFKSMKKGGKKSGNMYVQGDKDLSKAEAILICEGAATGGSVHMASGMPVVVAFDAGNLQAVANTLRETYPEKEIVVLGDDDRHKENTPTGNRGRRDAEQTAEKVRGTALFPQFGKDQVGSEFKDWNDLHKARGKETVNRQIRQGLDRIKQRKEIERQKEKQKERQRVPERGRESAGISR